MNTRYIGWGGGAAITAAVAMLFAGEAPTEPPPAPRAHAAAIPPALLLHRQGEAQTVAPRGSVLRRISLHELGFAEGISFEGLNGARDLFVRVGDPGSISAMTLRLHYDATSAFTTRRALEVRIGERIAEARQLEQREDAILEIPVSRGDVRNGFLKISLRYSGAITDQRCVDERVSGANLRILADSGLDLQIARDRIAADQLPGELAIRWTGKESSGQAAAAFTLAAASGAVGFGPSVPSGEPWQQTSVELAEGGAPPLSLTSDPVPHLKIGGNDPALAARMYNSRFRGLLGPLDVSTLARTVAKAKPEFVSFASLGADTGIQEIVERGTWHLAVGANRLPAGKTLRSAVLDVAVADDGGDIKPVISATLNGVLLGSTIAEPGERNQLIVDIPAGLASLSNQLDVTVTRVPKGGDCINAPQGYDAQLLPTSRFELVDAPQPDDFHELAAAFAGGVTIDLAGGAGQVPATSRLLSGLLGGATPISVTYGKGPISSPSVVVSDTAPAGTDPAVRFDRGRVAITDQGGETVLSSANLNTLTVVQLLDDGGRPVLWIRPGRDFAAVAKLPASEQLGAGDVAFIGPEGIKFAYSTRRDSLLQIHYPDRFSLAQFVARHRGLLILFGWLSVSAGFIWLLRRIYLARRKEG